MLSHIRKKNGTLPSKKRQLQLASLSVAAILSALACSIYSKNLKSHNQMDPICQKTEPACQNTKQVNDKTHNASSEVATEQDKEFIKHATQKQPTKIIKKNITPSWDENSPLSNLDLGEEHKKRFDGDVSQLPLLREAPNGTKTYQGDRTLVIVSPNGVVGFLPDFND